MADINILTSDIYNKIAAGEVVERPSSVLKELIDNSIDAGSTEIIISVCGGGIENITVRDNGGGISKKNILKAFLPHATSKIKSEEDLYKIESLGFRGEALASIASVSKIELISSCQGDCNYIKLEGGAVTEKGASSLPEGTSISVSELFYNTPARLKFLKSPKTEENELANMISRCILINPQLRIKYSVNGKLVFESYGKSPLDALMCIYGKDIANNIIEINQRSGDCSITGFIGTPQSSKPNRTYQTLSINGRYVVNQTVSAAIANAYGGLLMTRQYPFFVLNLSLPVSDIDVNVHPNKLDVRFRDAKRVSGTFYNTVLTVLTGAAKKGIEETIEQKISENKPAAANTQLPVRDSYSSEILRKYDRVPDCESNAYKIADIYNIDIAEKYKIVPSAPVSAAKKSFNYEIKGVVLNTYIIAEANDAVIFIDQHAAHERLLFDRFENEINNSAVSVTNMLVPYIFGVNSSEEDYIISITDELRSLGIVTEQFGTNCFKVSQLPLLLTNFNIESFFKDILSDINSFKQQNIKSLLREAIIKKACRAAAKAGDILNKQDMQYIIDSLMNGSILQCPHGRPVAVFYTKKDFEKLFKRIV